MSEQIKKNKKVRGDVRREQIVQAALKIIGTRGMSKLTTSSIAKEMGMSEANLYRHVENKDQIYFACFEYVQEKISKNMEAAASSSASPLKRFKQFASLQLALMEKNRGFPRFMFSEDIHVNKKLREKFIHMMYTFSERLALLIKEGQRQKTIRADLNPKATALMFIGMVQGLAFRWSLSGFSFSLVKEGAKFWKNFEKCIQCQKI